jgi:hypothetical protein
MKRREFVKAASLVGAGMMMTPRTTLLLNAQEHVQEPTPDPDVKRVLVMFKCHFDAGFIDTQHNVVYGRYFEHFFPEAIEVTRAANAGGKRQYVWTTGSWLLFEYLEQASAVDRKKMEEAIARGDIAWHALPFTWETEMLSASMIEGSLAISQTLDRRYGKKMTGGAKMTDVPGHTRGLIAPLAKHGVDFLDIGVNDASAPAHVPPLFLWKNPAGAGLPVMYHLGYGGVTRVPGTDLALGVVVRGDNSGPHKPEEIENVHQNLKRRFPNAEVRAASLAEMAEGLKPHWDALPVVTAEIGDTWVYGCSSDPMKVARYREISRLREKWIERGAFALGDATDVALLRRVTLEAEHTWGADTKTWLDYDHYIPVDLKSALDGHGYKVMAFSWEEKRQDLLDGVAGLPETLRGEAQAAIDRLKPTEPAAAKAHPAGKAIETAHYTIGIDGATGAITRLRNKATGREWASATNPIGLFTYQTLSEKDYADFRAAYLQVQADWALKDFGKPNIEKFGAVSREWQPTRATVEVEETSDGHRILIRPVIEDDAAFDSGVASFPKKIYVELLLPKNEAVVHVNVSWFEKPATRMPESIWFTFNPVVEDQKGWMLDKSGEAISPFEVVEAGNRHMHAVGRGFTHRKGGERFEVETLDTALVSMGVRKVQYYSNEQPDLTAGMQSNLYNNAWGTNYIMWYGEDARFRYVVRA